MLANNTFWVGSLQLTKLINMNLSTDESAWKLLCLKTLICRVLKGGLLIVIVPSLPELLKVRGGWFFYLVVIRRIGERTKSSQERLRLLCFVGQGFKGFAKLCLFFIIYFSEYVVFISDLLTYALMKLGFKI